MIFDWRNTAWEIKAGVPHVAILPLASLDPHHLHLPIGAHQFILSEIALRVGEGYPFPAFLLPTWPFGTSALTSWQTITRKALANPTLAGRVSAVLPGAISLEYPTLWAVVRDIVESIYAHGIQRVVVINDLGSVSGSTALPKGNSIVKTAVRQLNYETPGLSAIWVQPFVAGREALVKLFPASGQEGDGVERAILMHLDSSMLSSATLGGTGEISAEKGRLALDSVVQATLAYIENTFTLLDRLKT